MFLVKAALHLIIEPLLYLVNLSLLSGAFPIVLKTDKVIPIYKKGDNPNIDNYKPIIMPSVFPKVFEYGFIHRLLAFTEKYNIFLKNERWVESFISNRQQFVSINKDITSDKTSVNIGVAQGSAHGPFLFILYLNDLDKLAVLTMFIIYAYIYTYF
nr:unnamed protein product [Callosobruchus chinensis]